jgi:hypothetical protein
MSQKEARMSADEAARNMKYGRLGWVRRAIGSALAFWALSLFAGGVATPWVSDRVSAEAPPRDYLVTFQFSQNNKEAAPGTEDQLTVIFSSRSVEGPTPPRPFFGEDIMQEFSFSGSDIVGGSLRFARRVREKSFVEARYIRVVNYGQRGWAGDKIWLAVDGEEILNGVPMSPRRGAAAAKGFQNFNPRNWSQRTYWEAELQQYRRAPIRKF